MEHINSYWSPSNKPRRRLEFPSWSWVGRAGKVKYLVDQNVGYERFIPLVDSIHLELGPGRVEELNSYFRGSEGDKDDLSYVRALHLDCLVASLDRLWIEDRKDLSKWLVDGCEAFMCLSQAPVGDIADKFGNRSWEFLVLGLEG